ncbi:MAG: TRAP transporter fused permease subunit [Chloroflexota bacterium]
MARATAVALAIFHLYTAGTVPLTDMRQRVVHVMLGFVLTFAVYSGRRRVESKIPAYDFVLMAMIAAGSINAFIKYEWFLTHIGWSSALDTALGTVTLLLCVEAARRITGLVFPTIVVLGIAYALAGPLVPGQFGHAGFDIVYVVQELYQTTNGIWGYVVGISANIVAMFLIFGAFLVFTGGGQTFVNLALWLTGRYRGGPAMSAVIGSALFGTISGSALANVAGTGNFTIPLMKRLGYRPEFAGAVEAVASDGGQIMPPVMGAAAFILAEFVGLRYTDVAIAAAIPAVLYFTAVLFYVRFEALRLKLPPVPKEEIPSARSFLGWGQLAPFVLPVVILLYFIGEGFSPAKSCFFAAMSALVIFLFSDFNLSHMRERAGKIVFGLNRGGLAIVEVVSLLVAANIVIDVLTMTGVTVKISQLVVSVGGDMPLLGLFLTMVVALMLGMGLPTSAAYVLTVAVAAPPLIRLGYPILSVHLFVFYYAVLSLITPPVCPACYAAAAIARTSWLKVAWVALRLAAVVYIVPYVWMYQPALLMQGSAASIALAALTTLAGALCLATGLVGHFTSRLGPPTRLFVIAAGIMFVLPQLSWSAYGIAVLAAAFVSHKVQTRVKKAALARPG